MARDARVADALRGGALCSLIAGAAWLPPERALRFTLLFLALAAQRRFLRAHLDAIAGGTLLGSAWVGSVQVQSVNEAGNIVAHAVVPGIVACIITEAAWPRLHKAAKPRSVVSMIVAVAFASLALAVAWEAYELWARSYFRQPMIRVSSRDTLCDVVSGVLGGAAMTLIWASARRSPVSRSQGRSAQGPD
jgi:hypothetical protein